MLRSFLLSGRVLLLALGPLLSSSANCDTCINKYRYYDRYKEPECHYSLLPHQLLGVAHLSFWLFFYVYILDATLDLLGFDSKGHEPKDCCHVFHFIF